MAQIPTDDSHQAQISAWTTGRDKWHKFEKIMADYINSLSVVQINNIDNRAVMDGCIFKWNPALLLIKYVLINKWINPCHIFHHHAYWLGWLATSWNGDEILDENWNKVLKAKSDILLSLKVSDASEKKTINIGISVKTCNNASPTNAQLYFTTANGFCNKLLRSNNIQISFEAEKAMKMFCGDEGFRPKDMEPEKMISRKSEHDRYFWEELPEIWRNELTILFTDKQNEITELLLSKAYENDPFPPEFLIHQTKKYLSFGDVEVALFRIKDLVLLSKKFGEFWFKDYKVKKGSYKWDPNTHKDPRFWIVQMQRGWQKQHPTQLQFNLKSGYFYHLKELI